MKIVKWTCISVLLLLSMLVGSVYLFDKDYLLKAVRVTYFNGYNSAFIDDHPYFHNRTIAAGSPQAWPESAAYNSVALSDSLRQLHQQMGTTAYLIIKGDSLWHESYYQGYAADSLTNSFSMAKSILAAAVGKALSLGYITSLDEPVKKYLPELTGAYAEEVTIGDLLSMRSGMLWDEAHNDPFSITTKAYFHEHLSHTMLQLPIAFKPGTFQYKSGDSQLLAMVLSKVLDSNLSTFISTYFWKPMGASKDALWQYNPQDGVEKAFCCIASQATDFARFGKLYAHQGNWEGHQLLDSAFVQASLRPLTADTPQYGYGWWLGTYNSKKTYTMNGHLGQYVIAIPEDQLIIVRLGQQSDKKGMQNPQSAFYQYIHQAYKMLESKSLKHIEQ